MPVLWTLLHVVRATTSWPLGRLADRFGRRGALAAGWIWYALCYVGFAGATAAWHAWALFASYGLVAGLTEGTERALVAAAVPPEQRGRALGLYNLISGAGLFTASVIGGCLGCDDESLEARYFDSSDIPWADLAFRSTREALREFLG